MLRIVLIASLVAGSKDCAMEFASVLGQLGADAILISSAETIEAVRSDLYRYPGPGTGVFTYGSIIDRIELVAIRTGR